MGHSRTLLENKNVLDSSGEFWVVLGVLCRDWAWAGQDEGGFFEQAEKRALTLLQECFETRNEESWPWLFHIGEGKTTLDEVWVLQAAQIPYYTKLTWARLHPFRVTEKRGWLMLPSQNIPHNTAQRLLGLCQQDREEQWLQPPLVCILRSPLGTDSLKSCTGRVSSD